MVMAAVQFYEVVLFVHIVALVLAFGPTFAYPLFLMAAERTGGRGVPGVAEAIKIWDRAVGNAGLAVLLLTGIYLVIDRWEFGDFFVSWGFAAIIVLTAMKLAFLDVKSRKLSEIAERDVASAPKQGPVELSDECRSLVDGINRAGGVAGLIVLLTIYVMTAKPFG